MYLELGVKYWRYHKKRALFILFSIFLSVAALVSATLLVKSNRVQQLEADLYSCGNCDFQLYNISEAAEKKLRSDMRFEKFGSVYRCGYAKGSAGTDFEIGYIEDKSSEDMFHLTPLQGRYPEKPGEICIDKVTLNTMGYPAQTGQEITLSCMDWEKKELRNVSFTVVGIIEQIVIDEDGAQYMRREYYPIEAGEESIICPFAYIFSEEAREVYGENFEKILLADVIITDDFDDFDMKKLLVQDYDKEDFLYDPTYSNRSYLAHLVLGVLDGLGYHEAENLLGTDTVQMDFYSAVLIPVFFVLVVLVTFFSLYNAISMTFSERIRQNGMFRCLGMERFHCQCHLVLEMGVLLIPGILGGYGMGFLIYTIVQQVQKNLFGIQVMGAYDISEYFRPYVEAVTVNPVTFPLLAICIALVPAVVIPAIRSGRVSPVAACAVKNCLQKKQKRFQALLYLNLFVVIMAAVFGYCYFSADNDRKTYNYQKQLSSTGVSQWDYYMEQDKVFTAMGWGDELRHDTGISAKDLKLIQENSAVDETETVIINLSTKVSVKDSPENTDTMNALEGTDITELTFPVYSQEERDIYDLRIEREMKHRGYQKNEKVYQVPSIGVEDKAWGNLEQYVVEGSIHTEKIKEGTEVVLAVTDIENCTYHVGDRLPLNDDLYPDKIDKSEAYRAGGTLDFVEPTYKAEGNNWPQYCFAKRKKLEVTVGAVIVVNDEMAQQKYLYNYSGVFPWNVVVSNETFANWELPDNRYSKLWVSCREGADVTKFERLWYRVLLHGQLMRNYVAQDIRDRITATNRSGMTLFFSMLFMVAIISIIGTINAFSMGIRTEKKRFALLRSMGETKGRLLQKKWKVNFLFLFIGGCLSLIPVYIYDRIARHAQKLIDDSYTEGNILPDGHWAYGIIRYYLADFHPVAAAVIISLAACLFTGLVIWLCMKKELDCSIAEGIREEE